MDLRIVGFIDFNNMARSFEYAIVNDNVYMFQNFIKYLDKLTTVRFSNLVNNEYYVCLMSKILAYDAFKCFKYLICFPEYDNTVLLNINK